MFKQGDAVRVTSGQLAGCEGVVIRDERYIENTASVARDRVWVLTNEGDNPQVFRPRELVSA